MGDPVLHADCEPLAFLLGTWRGEGKGVYPTIATFAYGEEVRFWHVGKPFLAYTQRTWALDDRRPLHGESGYWRPQPDGRLEVVLAHPTGVAEVTEGRIDGDVIELKATTVARTSSAKEITGLARRFERAGDVLTYTVDMAAVGQPMQRHLEARLQRVQE